MKDENGIEVPDISIVPVGLLNAFRRRDRAMLTHHAVRFEGTIEVTNTVLFLKTLASGIGSAKAFGFGLLSVARSELDDRQGR